ncbi:hypothetical protein [Methanolapillus millepedarum]
MDKIFGRNKKKPVQRLDWSLEDESRRQKDYIASSEYVIPSDKIMSGMIREMESGHIFFSTNIFFRVDYIGKENEWYKKRDYTFETLTLRKKTEEEHQKKSIFHHADDAEKPNPPVYILEGDGIFIKENNSGLICETEETNCHVYAEITYENRLIHIKDCKGFEQTDDWYAFMLLFKMIEYYYKPSGDSITIKKENENISENKTGETPIPNQSYF